MLFFLKKDGILLFFKIGEKYFINHFTSSSEELFWSEFSSKESSEDSEVFGGSRARGGERTAYFCMYRASLWRLCLSQCLCNFFSFFFLWIFNFFCSVLCRVSFGLENFLSSPDFLDSADLSCKLVPLSWLSVEILRFLKLEIGSGS